MRRTDVSVENQAVPAAASVVPVRHRLPIAEAFEKGQGAFDVQLAPDGKGVVLYDRAVIEDDAPGACPGGENWQVPRGKVVGKLIAKKVLRVDRPVAKAQRLVLWAGALSTETAPLSVRVNGRKFEPQPFEEEPGNREVHVVELRPRILHEGDNEIILSCEGERGWWVGMAQRADLHRNAPDRKDRPVRSFRSTDRGRTWKELISASEQLAGEFMVRLLMDQYAARGELIGPVIDLGELAGRKTILPPRVEVASATLTASQRLPKGTSVELSLRAGTTPLYEAASWGQWLAPDAEGKLAGPLARFVQWRAVLRTDDPKVTPFLGTVELRADLRRSAPAWTDKARVLERVNPEPRHTSIPFEYESFDQPELAEIRQTYKLDEVVAGAATELEKMRRLRDWVSRQWTYDPPMPPYPAWDAREILRRKQGYCVQYAITYMQCALALGMQTRFTFGMVPRCRVDGKGMCGHEVNESWSNEYGKWVLMDANANETFVAAEGGVPSSMLDLHEELLDTYFPAQAMGAGLNEFPAERPSTRTRIWKALEIAPREAPYPVRLKWGNVRWMPRNNFFAHRFPEPLAQGRCGWVWNGYWSWCDERTPRLTNYGQHTARRADIEWTINLVHWAAAPADEPGVVEMLLGTLTPDFETFLVCVDGGEWQPCGAAFPWRLHAGSNHVEMRVRTRGGVLGKTSEAEVKYTGK
jgi:hypothetical protein